MSQARANHYKDVIGGDTATFNGIPLRRGAIDPENRIINGAFDLWNRGTSFSSTGYGADRWINDFVGGTFQTTRQAFTLGEMLGSNNPMFFKRVTVSGQTLPSQYAVVAQPIEGARSYAGQTITVLGWARRSSGNGNMAVSIAQAFGTGGAGISPTVFNFAATVPLTTSWAPFAVTINVPSVTGRIFGTNGNDFLQIQFWLSAGSDRNFVTNSMGLQTIGVDFWGIHVKLGTHTADAVQFYHQPDIGEELTRARRFFQVIGERAGNEFVYVAYGVAGSTYYIPMPLPVVMRAAPSAVARGSWNLSNISSFSVSATRSGFRFNATVTATGNFLFQNSLTDSQLWFDAEL